MSEYEHRKVLWSGIHELDDKTATNQTNFEKYFYNISNNFDARDA